MNMETEKDNKINNSEFWSEENLNKENIMKVSNNEKYHKKSFIKGLGVTGGVALIVLAIVSVVGYKFLGQPALVLYTSARTLKEDLGLISQSVTSRDLVTLEDVLKKTEVDLDKLKESKENKFGWMNGKKILKIGEFYADSDRFINVGHLSIKAIRETMEIVTPFADAAGLRVLEEQEVAQEEGLMEAFRTWVSLMPQVAEDMDRVFETLALIGEELKPINTDKYPKYIRGVPVRENVEFAKKSLINAGKFAPDIKKALVIVPDLLGIDHIYARRYMVIMQNNMEIRPTGGFWTNYATFKIKDALLQSDFTSKDFYSIDNTLDIIDATYDFPDAPPAYSKYLKVERWYARDSNSSPDLPTSIDQFMFYYNMGSKIDPTEVKPVDGIMTIDTQVIKELIDVTGPVTVNGITYTSENVILELERLASLNVLEQINRKGVLGDLMEQMLINVFESDKYLWSKLIDKVVDLSVRKHIQGFHFDEDAQALIEKYGFAGTVTQDVEGDYVYVVSTNLGGDKTNWFTNKVVDQKLEKEGDRWLETVSITYTYEEPGADFAPFLKRFRDWVRVYVPIGSEFISVDGSEDQSDVGTGVGEELNKAYYYGYVELGPGETKTITFKYYLPDGTVSGDVYKVLIQKQPGIVSEIHNVSIGGKTTEIELVRDETVTVKL